MSTCELKHRVRVIVDVTAEPGSQDLGHLVHGLVERGRRRRVRRGGGRGVLACSGNAVAQSHYRRRRQNRHVLENCAIANLPADHRLSAEGHRIELTTGENGERPSARRDGCNPVAAP